VRLTDDASDFVETAVRAERRAQRRVYLIGGTLLVGLTAAIAALLIANVREKHNTEVRNEAERARASLDACLTKVSRMENDRQALDYDKQVCDGTVKAFEQARDRENEKLLLLDSDVQLADHCRKLKQDAKARSDAPKPLGKQ
jgi:Tfp pilus assembly protein PilN